MYSMSSRTNILHFTVILIITLTNIAEVHIPLSASEILILLPYIYMGCVKWTRGTVQMGSTAC